jgi:hypothetical protein
MSEELQLRVSGQRLDSFSEKLGRSRETELLGAHFKRFSQFVIPSRRKEIRVVKSTECVGHVAGFQSSRNNKDDSFGLLGKNVEGEPNLFLQISRFRY